MQVHTHIPTVLPCAIELQCAIRWVIVTGLSHESTHISLSFSNVGKLLAGDLCMSVFKTGGT